MTSDTRHALHLTLLPGAFVVCRLGPNEGIPVAIAEARPASITRTSDELSIVCAEDLAPEGAVCERGWRCLGVQGPLPFSTTGVLASLAVPLADAGVSIFAISTFDTDYLLVQDAQMERAIGALQAAGHVIQR